ncbi:alpha-ketoglutarate-dependent dioxygenase AlkB [Ferrovibrio sp.]|uniref:alpha-ketoglutarate-dependent dioxygenase AlkB family protein n=1 Tax=Ferrovibrio sp. TaxID=1917215 RepID=UPI000CC74195|nr:alpha-ketoglutarate-dependent dioxygenase AlkB [Ferrovibrio sp.]PJI38969.1 MAG: alkylated DNA repair dioxygenase [Ferrovibrio sp.]
MPRTDSGTVFAPLPGFRLLLGFLDATRQRDLMAAVQAVLAEAPAYHAAMPKTGQKMSVAMSNAGALGWYTDKDGGYRYIAQHPETGRAWPAIPQIALDVWRAVVPEASEPEACLINLYRDTAKMGLHQDRDEADFSAPVVSISLGDEALFRLGGTTRKAPTRAFKLSSGDVLVLGGEARLAFHGIDRVLPGTSRLVPGGGRINLTLRRVT